MALLKKTHVTELGAKLERRESLCDQRQIEFMRVPLKKE